MTNNTGNTNGAIQEIFDDGGDGVGGVEPLRELYGVNDDLIWIDTIA